LASGSDGSETVGPGAGCVVEFVGNPPDMKILAAGFLRCGKLMGCLAAGLLAVIWMGGCGLPENMHFVGVSTELTRPRALIVTEPYTAVRVTYPPGHYLMVMADDEGYYYEAPHKLLYSGVIPVNYQLCDGGLYVYRDNPLRVRAYIALPEGPIRKLPGDCDSLKFQFQR